MAKSLIPLLPTSGEYNLTEEEMIALSWLVISGGSREDIFLRFLRPDFIGSKSKVALKAAVTQFFAGKDVMSYMENYRDFITDYLKKSSVKEEAPKMSIDDRKNLAKNKLVEFATQLATNIEDAEDPEVVLKIADKIGLLDVQEQVEQPRRYLPESCLSGCRYRLFVEENCEDECQYCKYKKFGEEQGVHYEKTNMLDTDGDRPDKG